jgi:hypothetical protein
MAEHLANQGVNLADGLRDADIASVEERFDFRFPPDLRALLQKVLPISHGFPDWRDGDTEELRAFVDEPIDGLLYDVLQGVFWLRDWGTRPGSDARAMDLARTRLADAPRLIPFHGHRYLSSIPREAGNPVFSVVQADVVIYGLDLADNLWLDFGVPKPRGGRVTARDIPFWTEVIRWNNTPIGDA